MRVLEKLKALRNFDVIVSGERVDSTQFGWVMMKYFVNVVKTFSLKTVGIGEVSKLDMVFGKPIQTKNISNHPWVVSIDALVEILDLAIEEIERLENDLGRGKKDL